MVIKRVFVAVLCLISLGGLINIGYSFFNQLACEGQPINNNVAPTKDQQILGNQVIGQTFVAPRNHLNRIDIFFQTYQRRNTHDVTLHLFEVPNADTYSLDGPEVFSTTFNASAVSDQSWRSFTLSPIADSAGKAYLITLESPESSEGNAITVGGIERNSYLPGTAFLGPIPVPADITFRSCYQLTLSEKLQVLATQVTHNRPSLWGNFAFYWLSLVLYGLFLLGFGWQLVRWIL